MKILILSFVAIGLISCEGLRANNEIKFKNLKQNYMLFHVVLNFYKIEEILKKK